MSFTTFKDKYVFHLFPLWSEPLQDSFAHSIEEFGILGLSYADEVENYPRYKGIYKYICKNKAGAAEINDLFDDRLGRLGAFWFPSFKEDIVLTSNIGASDLNIDVEDIEYSTFFPATPGTGRYIFIYVNSNKWFARKITGVPSSTSLTMESSLGEAITMARVKMISFLYLGRFDIDEIEWTYVTPDVSITDLYFIELPNEYADLS